MAKFEPARQLHFDSLDQVLAEAKRIEQHPDAATVGTWTASQNIWHVARYIQASVEGYPFTVPWYFKLLGPMIKKKMISSKMASGFKTDDGVQEHMEPQRQPAEETTMERAVPMLERWVNEAKAKGFIAKNPVFGRMTTEQWVALHCRHAELHFGLIELPSET